MAALPLTPIADDLVRLDVPVPYRNLQTVAVYLLGDGDEWVILDTGMNTPHARAVWEAVFQTEAFRPGRIRAIWLTHAHPDHFGLAGWLQRRVEAVRGEPVPVAATAAEWAIVDRYWVGSATEDAELAAFFAQCGLPERYLAPFAADLPQARQVTRPHPTRRALLHPGEQRTVGQRSWTIRHVPGHSDGQVALHDEDDATMLVGDHVLAHVTPNIGHWPGGLDDPLGAYLSSLDALASMRVEVMWPGHGPAIRDGASRLRALRAHHDDRLAQMHRVARRGATVFEVAAQAFDLERLSPAEVRFATAETLAHLVYLVRRGRLERQAGPVWYFSDGSA